MGSNSITQLQTLVDDNKHVLTDGAYIEACRLMKQIFEEKAICCVVAEAVGLTYFDSEDNACNEIRVHQSFLRIKCTRILDTEELKYSGLNVLELLQRGKYRHYWIYSGNNYHLFPRTINPPHSDEGMSNSVTIIGVE